ncbi:HWE histidine kinase domain-containing protein [Notoacmeibacter sp. MSK16QG-6]|uniref:HWE histidine kinase domain-containing protein n=1 Tax=Notoacmeibacter sp. MSK16QG-6 TaxID=2957982 RepID=UPI00209E86D7|nr:HWE histidine kinase domain-containing protein [Notoacmeibacter sp. MSK16QG-6]MCP1198816.1 GAF domain-containing protein [Notoacmeibacter sp. MSK16QG-6]
MNEFFDAEKTQVDLTNCDREPIHLLGRIQPFGFLVAASADWVVSHVSLNVDEFLSFNADAMVGEPLKNFLPQRSLHAIRNRLQTISNSDGRERLRNVSIDDSDRLFDVSIHVTDDSATTVMEFEPARLDESSEEELLLVRGALPRLARHDTVEGLARDGARYLQFMSGFDRVMVYQFLPDGSGEVIAEARQSRLEPFLGLRYPATDIPQQARALYLKQTLRLIADVGEDGVAIHPPRGTDGQPIDLSSSVLRSVSPIHLEYLRNMGVQASMSVSIIINGKLWGLFACHHEAPLVIDHIKRGVAEMFGELFSMMLASRLNHDERKADKEVQRLTNSFSATVSPDEDPIAGISPTLERFSSLLDAQGFAIVIDQNRQTFGESPTDIELDQIIRFLNRSAASKIFASSHMSGLFPEAKSFSDRVAGMLAIPISRRPRDYIIFFRREVLKEVTWAGNPEKPVEVGPNGIRLTPRKSFEAWQDEQRGHSEIWRSAHLRIAEQLRMVMLEVVLRLTDEVARERKIAQERQELLIAELNHRVRNILSLVKGIISQSRGTDLSLNDYIEILDTRIQSLARAHDQITQHNWTAASLQRMIEIEAASYLGDGHERIRLEGEDCLLEPQAFATLALVVHELTTNSAKYGALSASAGYVKVKTSWENDGTFTIDWLERGGPAVQAPKRRGFGSTIVERSIPYELKGKASIDYELSGLHAAFTLPARHVARPKDEARPSPSRSNKRKPSSDSDPLPKRFLVAEDNLILAMELEDILLANGAESVDVAANLSDGKAIAGGSELDFAILDVNLGSATSFPIAEILAERGIPFGFATGYGEELTVPKNLGKRCCIAKPYDRDSIHGFIRDVIETKQAQSD